MAQRGRKSAASLAVVAPIPGARRPPPPELTPEQAEVWRQVVASRPADWFDDGSASILAAHCRHVVAAQMLAAEIDRFTPADLKHKGELGLYECQSALDRDPGSAWNRGSVADCVVIMPGRAGAHAAGRACRGHTSGGGSASAW
jgi:hypothetical protein